MSFIGEWKKIMVNSVRVYFSATKSTYCAMKSWSMKDPKGIFLNGKDQSEKTAYYVIPAI